MIKTRLGAQRYNNRMDKIFEQARANGALDSGVHALMSMQDKMFSEAQANEQAINDIENVMLQMVDLSDQVTRSDLQGIVGAEARNLYWKLKETK